MISKIIRIEKKMLINVISYLQGGQGKFIRDGWMMSKHVTKKKEKGSNIWGTVGECHPLGLWPKSEKPYIHPEGLQLFAWDRGNPIPSSKEQRSWKYPIIKEELKAQNTPKSGWVNVKKIYYKYLGTYKYITNYFTTMVTRPKAY